MTRFERAAQMWPLLCHCALHRQTLTYEMAARLTGMAQQGLGSVLEPIQSYCLVNEIPALSSLVVGANTGVPGSGFIAAEDIALEQSKVYLWTWLEMSPPSIIDLQEATNLLPSNGKSLAELRRVVAMLPTAGEAD